MNHLKYSLNLRRKPNKKSFKVVTVAQIVEDATKVKAAGAKKFNMAAEFGLFQFQFHMQKRLSIKKVESTNKINSYFPFTEALPS